MAFVLVFFLLFFDFWNPFCLTIPRFEPPSYGCPARTQMLGQNAAGRRCWYQCDGQSLRCSDSLQCCNVFTSPHTMLYNVIHAVSSILSLRCALFLLKDIKSGQSPLMHAVESSKADMAHFLIEVMRTEGRLVTQLSLIFMLFLSKSYAA